MKKDNQEAKMNLKQYNILPKVRLTHAQLVENLRSVQEQVSRLSNKVEKLTDRLQEIGSRSFWQRIFRN
jgi:uncharacterized protein YlxW (UPF0749 family)